MEGFYGKVPHRGQAQQRRGVESGWMEKTGGEGMIISRHGMMEERSTDDEMGILDIPYLMLETKVKISVQLRYSDKIIL